MASCFVVQGFGKKTDYTDGRVLDLDASYAVIKEAVTACDMVCIRADEILHSGTIDKPMYEQLLGADLVIADLSTYNLNAAFELGIRYALRPHATLVVAEESFKPGFDVTHIVIRRYKHMGEDIGVKEAKRFKQALCEAIQGILAAAAVDSPVYTFLTNLDPPRTRVARAAGLEAAGHAVARSAAPQPGAAGAGEPSNKWLLDQARLALKGSDFATARQWLQTLHVRQPNDHHVVHQLALATYKSKQPDEHTALLAACELLKTISPATTNDPETLGLWGAVHKRLWNLDQDPKALDDCISAYGRGFQLKGDYYNGINYAMLLEARALVQAKGNRFDDAIADRVTARRARQEVLTLLAPLLAGSGEDRDLETRYWTLASAWEAHAGLGQAEEAEEAGERARGLQPPGWMVASTSEQIERIRRTQQELAAVLAAARN